LGAVPALVLSTLLAFFASWMFHSYQTFWLRGHFPLTWQDLVFWSILAGLVVVNTLTEVRRGRQRSLTPPRRTLLSELSLAVRTIGTFVTMCLLWTFWCRPSAEEMGDLLAAATHASWSQVALILGGLAGLGVAAVIFGHLSRADLERTATRRLAGGELTIWPSVLRVTGTAVLLLVLAGISRKLPTGSYAATLGEYLASNRPSELDMAIQRRGYYEDLEEAKPQQTNQTEGRPKGNLELEHAPEKWVVATDNFMRSELKPLARTRFKGKKLTINRWGMRDRDYEQKKPAGAYRIALLGSSNEMGMGVGDEDTFDNILEDRLNQEDVGEDTQKFEILNFSRSGHGALQKLLLLEENVFTFEPDAVFWMTYSPEAERLLDHLAKVYWRRVAIPDQFRPTLETVFHKAHLAKSLSSNQIVKALEPYGMELVDFTFHRLGDQCRQHGVKLYVLYRPEPFESQQLPGRYRNELMRLTRQCGATWLDLTSCYEGISNRQSIIMGGRDWHANELGHRLLAEELYRQLHPGRGSFILGATADQR
jgi:hypothetical protein